MIVSIIQIKNPTFFFYTNNEDGLLYSSIGGRCFSIYSWVDMNSQGITFPILISILLSVHKRDKLILSLTGIIGIIVAFLTRARYVMISILITFIQILYSKKTNYSKKGLYIVYFVTVVFALGIVAENFGFNYQKVIDERILEKGTDMHSASVRVLSYYVFVAKFPEHPYFGVGPKTGDDVIKLLEGKAPLIHVGYLSYLYFYGIVGASLLFLALFYLVWDAWRIGKKSDFWGSFYGLLGFCFANTTFVYFNLSEMGIVLSVIYLRYYEKKAFLDIAVKQLLLNNKNMSVNIKVN